MNEELLMKVSEYRTIMSVVGKMREEGLVTAEEYAIIDTIMSRKYLDNSCTIFR